MGSPWLIPRKTNGKMLVCVTVFASVVPAVPKGNIRVELHKGEGHFDPLSCFTCYAWGKASGGSILVKLN